MPAHPLGLDQDRAVERAQRGGAVAGSLAGDPEPVLGGEADRLGDVLGALDEGDRARVAGRPPGSRRGAPRPSRRRSGWRFGPRSRSPVKSLIVQSSSGSARSVRADRRRLRPQPSSSLTISGGKRPWAATPGSASSRAASAAGSPISPPVVGDHAAVGAAAARRAARPRARAAPGSSAGRRRRAPAAPARVSASTGLLESAMTTKRSAAAATIFSRRWAPPPPLISQPSGVTWSVPSIAMSSRPSSLNSSTGIPSSRACSSVATEVATQRIPLRPRRGDRRQQVGDGRPGAEPDGHPVLDQLRRRLGRDPLLVVAAHGAALYPRSADFIYASRRDLCSRRWTRGSG